MGGAVSEMCSSVMECGCTVILAEIIQNLRNTAVAGRFCENGFNIIASVAALIVGIGAVGALIYMKFFKKK